MLVSVLCLVVHDCWALFVVCVHSDYVVLIDSSLEVAEVRLLAVGVMGNLLLSYGLGCWSWWTSEELCESTVVDSGACLSEATAILGGIEVDNSVAKGSVRVG